MSTPSKPDLTQTESLLAESAWLRRIAAGLISRQDVDDLHQEVWARAMAAPPSSSGHGLRAWIRTVARRAAGRHQAQARIRADAEWSVAREAADAASAGQTQEAGGSERLELHRELVEVIAELDPEDRDLIVWRYFDEEGNDKIAERLGVSAATARKRLSRALGRLRTQLARTGRGSEGWMSALALLGAPAGSLRFGAAGAGTGVGGGAGSFSALSAMVFSKAGAAGLAAAAAVSVLLLLGNGMGGGKEAPALDAQTASVAAPDGVPADPAGAKPEAEPLVAPTGETAERNTPSEGERALSNSMEGRVLRAGRFPVEGARVWLVAGDLTTPAVTTDAKGRYRLEGIPLGRDSFELATLRAATGNGKCAVTYSGLLSKAREERVQIRDMILEDSMDLEVAVMHEGAPVPGARVDVSVGRNHLPLGTASAGADGIVRFCDVPRRSVHAQSAAAGRALSGAASLTAASAAQSGEARLGISLQASTEVYVRVTDSSNGGSPVEGAQLEAWIMHQPPSRYFSSLRSTDFASTYVRQRGVHGVTDAAGEAVLLGVAEG
ncbi:MAG: sigma-70 family RNA polymerase sigma factor, partial [Planctomycetota bacterium]